MPPLQKAHRQHVLKPSQPEATRSAEPSAPARQDAPAGMPALQQRLGNRQLQRLLAPASDSPASIQRQEVKSAVRVTDAARPSTPEQKFEQAETAYRSGDYTSAIRLYEASLAMAPEMVVLNYNIAQCYRLLDDYGKALTYYRLYISLESSGPYARKARKFISNLEGLLQPFETAQRLYAEGDYASAAIWYTRMLDSVSGEHHGLMLYNLGQCNRNLKRNAAALRFYEDCLLELSDKSPFYAKAEKWIADLRASLGVDMGTDDLPLEDNEIARNHFTDAQIAFSAGQYGEALDAYTRAYEAAEDADAKAQITYNVAQCNRLLGRKATALTLYEQSLAMGLRGAYETKAKEFSQKLRQALGWPKKEF
jgi:tetratricopeptide (TPR) repeat protein